MNVAVVNELAAPAGRTSAARTVPGERLAVVTAAVAVAMMPLLVPGGPSNIAPVDLLIAVALGACILWAGAGGHRWRFPYVAPMALFLGGGAIGALRGPIPGTGAIALVQDVMLLLWCWALVNIASTPERAGVLLRAWAYSSVAWASLLFVGLATSTPALTGQTAREGARTTLTLIDPNIAANYFFLSIMVIWAAQCPRGRKARIVSYALLLAAIFTTGSTGALVSLGVGVGTAALLGIYRRAGLVPVVSAAALGAVAVFALHTSVNFAAIQDAAARSEHAFIRDGLGRGAQSVEYRDALLRESTVLYQRSGPLGAGPVSTKVRLEREQAPVVKEAHDDYLAALLERGVVGLAGLLTLIGVLAVRGFALARGAGVGTFARAAPNAHVLVGAVAGTLAAAAVYEVLHVRHVWALFALVAALSIWPKEAA